MSDSKIVPLFAPAPTVADTTHTTPAFSAATVAVAASALALTFATIPWHNRLLSTLTNQSEPDAQGTATPAMPPSAGSAEAA